MPSSQGALKVSLDSQNERMYKVPRFGLKSRLTAQKEMAFKTHTFQ